VKGSSKRREQVAETVRQVIADALVSEVRDPRVGFVTVTRVEVSSDLAHAVVGVSVMGEESDKTKALEGLTSAAGFLRGKLTRALRTRVVPELRFQLDKGVEHAARIETLLADLRREDQA